MLYCISNATIQEIEVFHMQIVFVTIDNWSIVNCCKSHLNFSFDFTIQIIKDHHDHFCTLLYHIICNLSNFYLVLHVHVLNNKLNKIVNIFLFSTVCTISCLSFYIQLNWSYMNVIKFCEWRSPFLWCVHETGEYWLSINLSCWRAWEREKLRKDCAFL